MIQFMPLNIDLTFFCISSELPGPFARSTYSPKVSRYVLTLGSRTTPPQVHRATGEQLHMCTCIHNRHHILCDPCSLWPGYEHSLFGKAKTQTARYSKTVHFVPHSQRVCQHHVNCTWNILIAYSILRTHAHPTQINPTHLRNCTENVCLSR